MGAPVNEFMSEDTVLKVGDTVSLNSGGHLMTVASIDDGAVTCNWSVRGDVKSKSFPAAALNKADQPLPPITLEALLLRAEQLRGSTSPELG
jgi:uncharacterized protein YodC (DUF2158 family)